MGKILCVKMHVYVFISQNKQSICELWENRKIVQVKLCTITTSDFLRLYKLFYILKLIKNKD